MNLLQSYSKIPWKAVLGLNTLVLVLGFAVIANQAINQPTRTSSKAANIDPTPTPIPTYPKEAPIIQDIEYFSGQPGDAVRIKGNYFGNFMWDSQLHLGNQNIPKYNILSWSNNAIDITIPDNATTNSITIRVNQKEATSPYPLTISTQTTDPTISLNNQILELRNHPTPATLTLHFHKPLDSQKVLSPTSKSDSTTLTWQIDATSTIPLIQLPDPFLIRFATLKSNQDILPLRFQPF